LRDNVKLMTLITGNSPAYIAYVNMDDLCYKFVNVKIETEFGRANFKKGGIFLALKGLHIPAQGNALGNTLQ